MGAGLTEVKPAQGFAAETSTASAILASSHLGFALSTTQVASGSVIGSGLGRKGTSVRWGMVGKIALGWLFTLPAAGIVGALTALLVKTGVVGVVIAAVAGTGAVLYMFLVSRKSQVGHHNAVEVEEAGQAVRFAKKKALARARAKARQPRLRPQRARQRVEGYTAMKWLELLTVGGATLVAAVTVVVLYSLGVRLTAIAGDQQAAAPGWVRSLAYAASASAASQCCSGCT